MHDPIFFSCHDSSYIIDLMHFHQLYPCFEFFNKNTILFTFKYKVWKPKMGSGGKENQETIRLLSRIEEYSNSKTPRQNKTAKKNFCKQIQGQDAKNFLKQILRNSLEFPVRYWIYKK